jgi:hypothetical protein
VQLLGGDGAGGPLAEIRVHREAFFAKCFWAGDIGFAEAYLDGDWDTPDLTAVIAHFIRNVETAPTLSGSRRARSAGLNLLRLANRLGHLLRHNTRAMARRNIAAHYDLSNDFFALWLDPAMMYSSARWPAHAPGLTLAEAQREKNDALCRQLRLRPEDRVLEIGTGWGGWALHAARTHGCHVTTVTISRQQYELARARVAGPGWRTASTCASATSAISRAVSTRSCRSRCSRRSVTATRRLSPRWWRACSRRTGCSRCSSSRVRILATISSAAGWTSSRSTSFRARCCSRSTG